jgi:hypothetical protein
MPRIILYGLRNLLLDFVLQIIESLDELLLFIKFQLYEALYCHQVAYLKLQELLMGQD